ncbi:ANTAR domain-containing protein [Mycobacterium sp. OAE908]
MARMEKYVPESETGTDGVVPGDLDKALLGGTPQRVGRFEYRYDTDSWIWSDTVARMHGYEPGEVVPTTELVLRHKHPDDLVRVKALLKRSSAPFSSRHRIRTVSGEVRSVVVVGEIVTDTDGDVVATRGFYIDVTESVDEELQRELGDKLDVIVADRAVIEQAKGMLMAVYNVDANAAFDILRWRSQELNIKLHHVARGVVEKVPALLTDSSRGPVDHFLMTMNSD